MLDAGTAVGNLGEIVFAHFFLLFKTERAVVGRDDLQMVLLESGPELFLVPLLAKRRRENVLCGFEAGLLHVLDRKIEILRAGLSVDRQAAIAGLADFFERVIAA